MKVMLESRFYPSEGYFWIINDRVVGPAVEVPHYNYEYSLANKTHENTWHHYKSKYLVDGYEVPFDYYPRGRVMVDPNYTSDNKFTSYSVMVFIDKCIDTNHHKNLITDYYNLDASSCLPIMWMASLKERAGIDHYTCHNCR